MWRCSSSGTREGAGRLGCTRSLDCACSTGSITCIMDPCGQMQLRWQHVGIVALPAGVHVLLSSNNLGVSTLAGAALLL